jgi:hypothetical protein
MAIALKTLREKLAAFLFSLSRRERVALPRRVRS